MKSPIIITVLLVLSAIGVKAQYVKSSQAQPDSIIKIIPVGEGRYSGYLYTIGGKLYTREDVAMRLMAYAPSAAEYRAVKNSITWSYISMGGAAIFSGLAIAEFAHHASENLNNAPTAGIVNGQPGFVYPPQQHYSQAGSYIFTGIATAFLTSTIINFARAALHSKKTINLYNQRFE